jgi:drug/metabolite transporter (DMT)-like permease
MAMHFGDKVLPPFVLASTRFMISGPLMLAFCLVRGIPIRPTRREFGLLAVIGILMLGCGNTAVLWSEQYLPTGFTALLFAAVPLHAALFEIFLPHSERLSLRGWIGIVIGLGGLTLLVSHSLHASVHGNLAQLIGAAVTLAGTICWTAASVLSRHTTLRISAFAAAGWEMLVAGLFNTCIMFSMGGYRGSHWGFTAFASIFYLVIFGSLVTYTAYLYLLDNVAVPKVATYAYINPMIAVLLGAIFLGERLTPVEYVGMGTILLAIFLVTSSKLKSGRPAAELEIAALEPRA